MKCELCHKADAQTVLFKTVDGKKKELYVCKNCATGDAKPEVTEEPIPKAGGQTKPMPPEAVEKLNALMNVIVNAAVELKGLPMNRTASNQEACPVCGATRESCRKDELLGCPACYKAFSHYLQPIIKDLQQAQAHTGMAPAGEQVKFRKKLLQEKLKTAISQQEYDQAARILREIDALMLQDTPPKKEDGKNE